VRWPLVAKKQRSDSPAIRFFHGFLFARLIDLASAAASVYLFSRFFFLVSAPHGAFVVPAGFVALGHRTAGLACFEFLLLSRFLFPVLPDAVAQSQVLFVFLFSQSPYPPLFGRFAFPLFLPWHPVTCESVVQLSSGLLLGTSCLPDVFFESPYNYPF